MKISSIAISVLITDTFIIIFAIYQQYFDWNIFPPAIESFITISFYSFQFFTLMIFLSAIVDEIRKISKALTKISHRL